MTITNVGTDTCAVSGSSKVYPVLPNGEWLDLAPTAFDDTPPGDMVALEPGERATLWLRFGSAAEGTESGHCPSPAELWVVLPGESKSLEVWHPEDADSLPPVCGENYGVSDWSAA